MKEFLKRILGWNKKSSLSQSLLRYKINHLRAALTCLLPIPLWRVLQNSGSDKQKRDGHSYGHTYGKYFWRFKYRPTKLLEIGIGGVAGDIGGQSLVAWRAFFPFGTIVACDIVPKYFLSTRKTRIYQTDQSSSEDLALLRDREGPFDIIIDDGSHLSAHQIFTFHEMFHSLKDGGIYIIEDVQTSFWSIDLAGTVWDGAHMCEIFGLLLSRIHPMLRRVSFSRT